MSNLSQYDLWLFDCDGVILKSNQIKSNAMYQVALHFSNVDIASTFKQYHMENAGVTRFVKFTYLFKNLLNKTDFEGEYQQALDMFAQICIEQLIDCPMTKGALQFLSQIPKEQNKFIVSAGTETELQHVFTQKNINQHFNGIYGGPRNKSQIFADILARYPDSKPIFFGDAKADYLVAKEYNTEFVFLSDYTDFLSWQDYFEHKNDVTIIGNFTEINDCQAKLT